MVSQYCLDCHSASVNKGGLDLERLSQEDATHHEREWEHVIRNMRARQMPPVGKERPPDIACMKLQVEFGVDPKMGNVDNCTPLMVACGIGVGSDQATEVAGEEPEVLVAAQYLLDLGVDVNAVDANGETAVYAAALKNLPKVIQFLADKGARIEIWNQKNKNGWTPLMIAEGNRLGNFKPSVETVFAVEKVMLAVGVTPESATPAVEAKRENYQR